MAILKTLPDLISAFNHNALLGLGNDDHPHYILVDGTRAFTGAVSGVTPTTAAHLTTKQYVDDLINNLSHGALDGLNNDDHLQYHTDARALLWLGTRSTTDLAEGTNLYYTEARVSANVDVAANTAHRSLTNNPHNVTISQALVADGSTDATVLELEELTDGSETSLHGHAASVISYDDTLNNTSLGADVQAALTALESRLYAEEIEIPDHGALSGLGDDDHPQYHTDARGDSRYYTKTQLDGGILDSRYYTETEVDALLAAQDEASELTFDPSSSSLVSTNIQAAIDEAVGRLDTAETNITTYSDHGNLSGLGDDDHTQYSRADGTRAFTGVVSGITPTLASHLATKGYVDTELSALVTDHGDLTGLADDDHTQYILVDGTRGFSGVVSGITPTLGSHLTTKDYVDSALQGITWQEPVLDKDLTTSPVSPTTGDRYIIAGIGGDWSTFSIGDIVEYNGSSWDNFTPTEGFAVWVEDEDAQYNFNGTSWVRFGSTVNHSNLTNLSADDHLQYLRTDGARTLTGNMAVDALVTIDGRDISVDGSTLDSLLASFNTHINGASSKHDASEIDVEGTYSKSASSPTDLETVLSEFNASMVAIEASIPPQVFQESGGTITPVVGSTLNMGINTTIQAESFENAPTDNMFIRNTLVGANMFFESTQGYVFALDTDDNANGAFQIKSTTTSGALLFDFQETGILTLLDPTGDSQVILNSSGFITWPFAATDAAVGLNAQGADLYLLNQGVDQDVIMRSTDSIEITYDSDNDSAISELKIGHNGTGGGQVTQILLNNSGILLDDTVDFNGNDLVDVGTISAPSGSTLQIEGTTDGVGNNPFLKLKEINAGGGGSNNSLLEVELANGTTVLEIQRGGDVFFNTDAELQGATGDGKLSFLNSGGDLNTIALAGQVVKIPSSGGATVFDIQRRIVNNSTNFGGNLGFYDDFRMNVGATGATGDTIQTTGTNVAGRAGIIIDNIGADALTALTATGTFLGRFRNLGVDKFTIAHEGGISIGELETSGLTHSSQGESIIGVNTASNAVTVTLTSADKRSGRLYLVHDISGNAATNNITINTESGNIDGGSSKTISDDRGSLIIYCDGTNYHTLSFGAAAPGSGGGSGRREIQDVHAGTVAPSNGAVGGNLGYFQALKFSASVNNDVFFQFPVPDNCDTTADINIICKYVMSTSEANDVKLDFNYVAADLNGDVDPVSATGTLTNTISPGTGSETLKKVTAFTIPAANIASNDVMISGNFIRDAVDGADTHSGEFQLLSIEIEYTVV